MMPPESLAEISPSTGSKNGAHIQGHACVQRCQYHKRRNVVSYLSKSAQSGIGRKMEAAYGKPTYEAAKKALAALKPSLQLMNQSARHSLEEGMEETLTLHRLRLTPMLKDSFRTTNCIENVNSLLEQLTHNVRRWTNSSQRHRWVATALLDIEPRLRRVKGYRHLPMLRQAIQAELDIKLKCAPEFEPPIELIDGLREAVVSSPSWRRYHGQTNPSPKDV